MYNLDVSSPCIADDMLLLSLSKVGLNKMLDICNTYSSMWRFEYNPSKCNVVSFNSSPKEQNTDWLLGHDSIPVADVYKHLGIELDKYISMTEAVTEACRKLKSTFFSITKSGLSPCGLNPLTFVTVYKTVVLPKALYGCELWNTLSTAHVSQLEKAHRLCLKYMQNLPMYTSTIFVLNSLGTIPIEHAIDHKKLIFFGQLCRLPAHYLAKQIFVNRLVRFVSGDRQCQGFIPGIYRLLTTVNVKVSYLKFIDC